MTILQLKLFDAIAGIKQINPNAVARCEIETVIETAKSSPTMFRHAETRAAQEIERLK